MEINLNEKLIEKSMAESIDKSIEKAFSSDYEIQEIIKKKIVDAVLGEALTDALNVAMEKVDLTSLSTALAEEIQRAACASTVSMLRNYTAKMMVGINHPNAYGEELNAQMAKALKRIKDYSRPGIER